MFSVNKEVDYALQLLGALHALPKEVNLSIKQFADKTGISFLFLQKIVSKLKQQGLVSSVQGSKGGYTLSADLQKISFKEIIETVSGPYGITTCLTPGKICDKETTCCIKPAMQKMNKDIINHLESTNVLDMIQQ